VKVRHDQRVLLLAFAAALPSAIAAFLLLYLGGYRWTTFAWVGSVIAVLWAFSAAALRHRIIFPLQTLANLLEALRERDFSFRARGANRNDPLGEALLELNALADSLRDERMGSLEATALLRTVMAEIDVAVLTFDNEDRLRFINRAGERLLGRPSEQLLVKTADELGLGAALRGDEQVVAIAFPGGSGQWQVRRGTFRQSGRPHHVVVLNDMSVPLRQQERDAWQRLIRVLGHELNNSLAPIKSIAGSLEQLAARNPLPADWRDDMQRGLGVIAGRTDALSRFTTGYTALARLPAPHKRDVDLPALVRRAVSLEGRMPIAVSAGETITLRADGDQVEQVLINLLRNAVDASLETGGEVSVGWIPNAHSVSVVVEDQGPGVGNTANLFVPFFTTKPQGSGIGLVLSRQIAEAHGGTLTLESRKDTRGARATLTLPL
jgi:two-component system nitrogen regulation sensor histidine kinase NtrY